jgi:hypothetical protein
MKKVAIVVAATALGLGGCASGNYKLYAETQQKIAESQAQAEIERYRAFSEIAAGGDVTAQVAAAISLNQASSNNNYRPSLKEPESMGDRLLKWTQALLPGASQLYGIYSRDSLAKQQSDNNLELAKDNNDTQVEIGHLIAGKDIPMNPVILNPIVLEDADGNQTVDYPEVVYPQ